MVWFQGTFAVNRKRLAELKGVNLMIRRAMRRPVTTWMMALSAIVLGIVAVTRLPLYYLPTYESLRLTVVVPYKSSAPQEIERLIVRPLEDALGDLSRLENMSSRAYATEGRVRLEFAYGTDMDLVAIDVRDRLDRVRRRLPPDITRISIRQWSSDDISILGLRLSWKGAPAQLHDVVNRLERRLQAIEGVAKVDVSGLQQKQIQIDVAPEHLAMHGLTTEGLATRLRRNHVNLSGGAIEDGGVRYLLRSMGEVRSPAELASLPLNASGLRLRDVAQIQYVTPPKTYSNRMDQKEALTIRVYRSDTANVVQVARVVHQTLENVQQQPGWDDLDIFVYHDSSRVIVTRLQHLLHSGLIEVGLALLVLWLFLKHVRVTFVLGLVIPISILATFLIMYLMREGLGSSISLNVVSLSGLMLSVGMLVDNSVVVLENIFRHRQGGKSAVEASITGAEEISRAVMVATATSVVVFLPTLFVEGHFSSRIQIEFALVVCAVLIASLGVALTLVPLLSSRVLQRVDTTATPLQTRFTQLYGAAIRWTLRYRWFVVALAAGVFGISLHLFLTEILPNKDLSRTPSRRLRIRVDLPRRTPFREIQATMEQLEAQLVKQRQTLELEHVLTTTRQRGSQILQVYFLPVEQSRTPTLTLQQRLIKTLPRLPGVTYRIRGGRTIGGGSPSVTVRLQGPNSEVLSHLAEVFKTQLEDVPGVYSVATDVDRGEEELHLTVDPERAQRRDVSPQRVAQTVAQAVSDRPTATMTFDGREVNILLRAGENGGLSAEQLQHMPVAANGRAETVRLGHVVAPHLQMTPASVSRENRLQTTKIVVRTAENMSMGKAARSIKAQLASLTLPDGYHWQLGRSYQRFVASQKQSTFSITLAIVLVYLIMAALFESFVLPLTIMVTVPFALSGVVGIFMLTQIPFSQMADLGMLILCGLAVNSGIMLVEAANQWRAQGLDRTEALIRSGQQRLRPIIMTVMTTLIGLMPMVLPLLLPSIFGATHRHVRSYAPIALAVMGGLCTSTVLTLIILPAVYVLFDDAVQAWRQLRGLLAYRQ